MSQQLSNTEIESYIRRQLIILIQLAAARGIRIEGLMYEALEFCDPD